MMLAATTLATLSAFSTFPGVATAQAPDLIPAASGNDVEALLQDLQGALGDDFAGATLGADGDVRLGFAGRDAVAAARRSPALAALVNHPKVAVVERNASLAQLDSAIDRTAGRLNALLAGNVGSAPKSWPYVAAVDIADNVVDVTLDPEHAGRRADVDRALRDDVAAGVVRIASGEVDQRPKCSSRTSCWPIRGGIELYDGGGPDGCTTGFVMRNSSGIKHISTAGHCGPWSSYHHNWTSVGTSAWSQDSGSVDGRIVRIENGTIGQPYNHVYRNANAATAVTSKVTTPSTTVIGTSICSLGAVGGERCGSLQSYNATFFGRTGFGQVNNTACNGDSGSAIVANTGSRAYGLLSGGPDGCAGPNYFTWISNVESASGYQVMLTPATETLGVNQTLRDAQYLQSPNGAYQARMQADGNFVIYTSSNVAIWATNTAGNTQMEAKMQGDGNFVVYACGIAVWSTRTNGQSGGTLTMQNDGNLVLYRYGTAVWASNTAR